uniref:Uncharacterized protein n=1 Tax=Ralstonia syzygii R24 TaxID=907261 RepID=G3A4Q8_9RALS|nr:hypothetical protein RALSY_30664 [Ralstonia syzygii R24]
MAPRVDAPVFQHCINPVSRKPNADKGLRHTSTVRPMTAPVKPPMPPPAGVGQTAPAPLSVRRMGFAMAVPMLEA